jgi:cytochrome P450
MFGDGIFTQDGDSWKHSREILKPQFVYREYENLAVFKEPIDDLLQTLSEMGDVVDLQPLFFRFTLDVTTAFLFGESIYSHSYAFILKSPLPLSICAKSCTGVLHHNNASRLLHITSRYPQVRVANWHIFRWSARNPARSVSSLSRMGAADASVRLSRPDTTITSREHGRRLSFLLPVASVGVEG